MQYKAFFGMVALAAIAHAAALAESLALEKRAVSLVWFSGDGCTGTAIATDSDATLDVCIWLGNSGIARSVSFSDVPNQILIFSALDSSHYPCNGGPQLNATGSGCATAPAR